VASSMRRTRNGLPDRLRWWHVFALSIIGACLVAGVIFFTRPATYAATASLLLNDQPDVLASLTSNSGDAVGTEQERISTILASRQIRDRLVEKYALDDKLQVDKDFAAEMLSYMTHIISQGGGLTITVSCRGYRKPQLALWSSMSMQDARRLCAELTNSYVAELDNYLSETALDQARKDRKFIEQARDNIQSELRDTEDSLQQLQTQYHLIDPDEKAMRTVDRVKAAQQAHAEAATQLEDVTSSLREARGQLRSVDALHVAKVVENRNPVISELEQKLAELQVDMAEQLASGKTAGHREVVQIQAAMDNINAQLKELEERVRGEFSQANNPTYDNLVSNVVELEIAGSGARARTAKSAALLAAAEARLAELPPVARDYATLKRKQQVQSELMASLTQSLAFAMIAEQRATTSSAFTVLDAAIPPSRRSGPPTLLAGGIAFVVFFITLGFNMIDRRAFGMF